MEPAGEFVLRFVAAGDAGDVTRAAEFVSYPVSVLTPSMNVTIADDLDLGQVLEATRQGREAAGITSFQYELVSVAQTGGHVATVIMETRRLGAGDEDLGTHQTTFVLDATSNGWKVCSLTVTDQLDSEADHRPIRGAFLTTFRSIFNAVIRPGRGPMQRTIYHAMAGSRH
ncbi:MAG: hypothetical protein AAGH68_09840 [Pseudomonadota bacterium]